MRNTIAWKNLACIAAGAVLICGAGRAQADTTMSTTTTTTTTSTDSNMSMPMQPTAVTGAVVRYYVDRSGYVTGADIQAADGIKMVHFAPGMATNMTTTYPIGAQTTVYVMPSMMGKMNSWTVVGVGDTPPTSPMAYTASASQVLMAEPYTTVGAKLTTVEGNLNSVITDNDGNVLALVVSSASTDGKGKTRSLIRVPAEFRAIGTMYNVADRAAPLFKGSKVEAVGYEEAPRYGAVSIYGTRLIATAITVNKRSIGAARIGPMKSGKYDTILGFNLFGNSMSSMGNDQMMAGKMGYMTYDPAMMNGMTPDMPMATTTDTTTTSSTTTTTTTPAM